MARPEIDDAVDALIGELIKQVGPVLVTALVSAAQQVGPILLGAIVDGLKNLTAKEVAYDEFQGRVKWIVLGIEAAYRNDPSWTSNDKYDAAFLAIRSYCAEVGKPLADRDINQLIEQYVPKGDPI